MPSTPRNGSPHVSLFDVFIGSGRTIRRSKGPPGLPLLSTSTVNLHSKSSIKVQPKGKPSSSSSQKQESTDKGANGKSTKPGSVDKDTNKNIENQVTGDKKHNPDHDLTSEQDAKLLELKTQNKSWKDIAEEMGKPAWLLKNRFKEIKNGDMTSGNKDENGAGEGKSKEKPRANQGKKQQPKQNKGKNDKQVMGKIENCDGKKEATFTLDQWVELIEGGSLTFGDLEAIGGIVAKDSSERWERIASRYFDHTGRRVSGEDIREKLMALDKKKA